MESILHLIVGASFEHAGNGRPLVSQLQCTSACIRAYASRSTLHFIADTLVGMGTYHSISIDDEPILLGGEILVVEIRVDLIDPSESTRPSVPFLSAGFHSSSYDGPVATPMLQHTLPKMRILLLVIYVCSVRCWSVTFVRRDGTGDVHRAPADGASYMQTSQTDYAPLSTTSSSPCTHRARDHLFYSSTSPSPPHNK